jgi:hypothetical protein
VTKTEVEVNELVRRTEERGWLREVLTWFALRRVRDRLGLREEAKFHLILTLAEARAWEVPSTDPG